LAWVLRWWPLPRLRLSGEYRPGGIALSPRGELQRMGVMLPPVHTMAAVAAGKFLILGSGRGAVSIELGKGDGEGRV
jgi:hypothetical protein